MNLGHGGTIESKTELRNDSPLGDTTPNDTPLKDARLIRDQLHRYIAAVLPFQLGEDNLPPMMARLAAPDVAFIDRHVQQTLRLVQRAGQKDVLLLGVGGGHLPDALATHLPEDVTLTVIELQPERVRQAMAAGRLQWWREAGRHRLVTDTSPWAIFVLLAQAGMTPQNTMMTLHPQLTDGERRALRGWQRQFALTQMMSLHREPLEIVPSENKLTLGIIVHPDEPRMDDFFAHVPAWVHEVVAVWDGSLVPDKAFASSAACPVSVRHIARPLAGDFAAQRNAVLGECKTEWILFLDGDERLSPKAWMMLPALLHQNVGGYVFTRWARIGDETVCHVGFGLWPDVQLRLFRIGENTRFVRKVHEVPQGIQGALALPLTVHIDHYSHVWKDPYTLAERLRIFDEAAGQAAMHRLNVEYPAVMCELFRVLEGVCEDGVCLLLPGVM